VKVGDLVRWERVEHQFAEVDVEYGIIVQLSRTGHDTHSAQVLFMDGATDWISTGRLQIVNEVHTA